MAINVNDLVVGTTYKIEVPKVTAVCNAIIRSGKAPECGGEMFMSYTFGVYLGTKTETIKDNEPEDPKSDESEDDDPYGEMGSDWYTTVFSIHNYKDAADGDKNVRLSGEVTFLQFMRTPDFNPWHRNVLLSNVSSWQKSRKWRSSRSHAIDIPKEIALEDMVFYEL